ncbi:MAG TPA: ABC transporter permease [Spirochaetia bacterium]|nr:ABC transporter permease [Spirochaetia bacterium]
MSTAVPARRANAVLELFNRNKRIITALLAIIFVFVLGQILVAGFLNLQQVLITTKLASFIALFGLCQMLVMSAGGSGLDLSVGYTATITAIFTATVMNGQNSNLCLGILVAIGIGLVVGGANGLLSAYMRLPSLVVTLAMSQILQGIINVYTAGKLITGKPSPVLQILAAKSSGTFPNIIFLLLAVAVVVMVILYRTKLGAILFGVGENETAAYLSGINTKLVRTVAFMMSGMLASLIGLLLLGNMGVAFKDMGSDYVLPSIAAAVVGGVSLRGGDGNYIGVILGAILLQTVLNLLVALGWGDAGKWTGFGIVLYLLLMAYVGNRRRR